MPSRRRTLQLCGMTLAGVAGCLDRTGQSNDEIPAETTSPHDEKPSNDDGGHDDEEIPDWKPTNSTRLTEENVLEIQSFDHGLLVRMSDSIGLVDHDDLTFDWQVAFDDEEIRDWRPYTVDESIYATSDISRESWTLHAIDVTSGEVYWRRDCDDPVFVVGRDDEQLYIVLRELNEGAGPEQAPYLEGRLAALDAATGELAWEHDIAKPDGYAVGPSGPYVMDADTDELLAFDADGGRQWTHEAGGRSVVVHETGVYSYGRQSSPFLALDHDGNIRWSLEENATNVVFDERIYLSGSPIRAIEHDGSLAWTYDVSGGVRRVDPVDGTLLVRPSDMDGQYVDAVSTADGRRKWRFDPGVTPLNQLDLSPSFALADTIGAIYGIRMDGEVVGQFDSGKVFDAVIDGDRVYAGAGDGHLYVLPTE